MSALELQNLTRRFGPTTAVDEVSLKIAPGELISLLGPSGSGKSTVLRMIGGFETASAGRILIEGRDMTPLPPERRPTGMVFQSHALWPHMTVAGNIGFGLRLRRLNRDEIRRKVDEVLALVGLAGFGERSPAKLSGGQQQRVALARSLVLEPKVLLLDEPFASLDQHLREHLRDEVREIQRRLGITMIFVTHGQDEALAIADRIAVMRAGRLEQIGRPEQIYRRPESEFVAGFIGQISFFDIEIRGGQANFGGLPLTLPLPDGPARLAIRPEDLALTPAPDGITPAARVTRVTDFGSHLSVDLMLADGNRLKAQAPAGQPLDEGARLIPKPRRVSVYRDGRLAFVTPDAPLAGGMPPPEPLPDMLGTLLSAAR
ncbi:ABC transporter ATP-binding protein [Paracoccus aminophilus]|uniref:ABC-type spermidine/putrescine transport systems, ATPase component n=1 Tax=Paracoccus aminophilus JCM 7686 TaxID=1367847 RepID=S5XMS5_PARAH|nr:ABC transporter ATP-binding protein [Paracoccus aminophilus]AGT08559.1 ABC-type spermidine/putrescine transport systems, ATPase component [Paracoccus aminophilus JCM 7686]